MGPINAGYELGLQYPRTAGILIGLLIVCVLLAVAIVPTRHD